MNRSKAPSDIDLLRIFVEEMESNGAPAKLIRLHIDNSLADRISKKIGTTVTTKQIQLLADKCLANEWIEHASMGGKYQNLSLTSTGLGVVRSVQRKEAALADRSVLKKTSDFIEDHKGLFIVIGTMIALIGLLIKIKV